MKKARKIAIITALALIISGTVLFAVGMYFSDWDINKLSIVKYENKSYEIGGSFKEIMIDADTDNIEIVPSDDGKCRIDCTDIEKVDHSAYVEENVLKIKRTDKRKWYEHIFISFQNPQMTLYLPAGQYEKLAIKSSTGTTRIPKDFSFNSIDIECSTGNVFCCSSVKTKASIKSSTGNITVKDISAGGLELTASTGNISLKNIKCYGNINIKVSTGSVNIGSVSCKKLVSTGSTGNLRVEKSLCSSDFYASRSTGNITLDRFDAASLYIKTSTGDVAGSLLSEKVYITDTSTGRVRVPKTVSGGKCEIKTSTGDITFE